MAAWITQWRSWARPRRIRGWRARRSNGLSKATTHLNALQTLFLHGPVRIRAQLAVAASKHPDRVLVALELPAQPGHGDIGKLATIGVRIGSGVPCAVTKAEEYWYLIKAPDIVRGIFHGRVDLVAVDVEGRAVDASQVRLGGRA